MRAPASSWAGYILMAQTCLCIFIQWICTIHAYKIYNNSWNMLPLLLLLYNVNTFDFHYDMFQFVVLARQLVIPAKSKRTQFCSNFYRKQFKMQNVRYFVTGDIAPEKGNLVHLQSHTNQRKLRNMSLFIHLFIYSFIHSFVLLFIHFLPTHPL